MFDCLFAGSFFESADARDLGLMTLFSLVLGRQQRQGGSQNL